MHKKERAEPVLYRETSISFRKAEIGESQIDWDRLYWQPVFDLVRFRNHTNADLLDAWLYPSGIICKSNNSWDISKAGSITFETEDFRFEKHVGCEPLVVTPKNGLPQVTFRMVGRQLQIADVT